MLRYLVVGLASCGRIWFEPLGGGAPGDGSGSSTSDVPAGTLPPGGETCTTATPIAFGTSGTGSIAGATNDVQFPPCADGVDIVYQLSAATAGLHHIVIVPTFNGIMTTSTMCPPLTGGCAALSANMTGDEMASFEVGTNYVIIEKTSGAGTSFDLTIQ